MRRDITPADVARVFEVPRAVVGLPSPRRWSRAWWTERTYPEAKPGLVKVVATVLRRRGKL